MEKSERIVIRGVVSRDPELSRTDKGKLFTRVNVAADEVQIEGAKMNAQDHKWQNAVFWGVDAADQVAQLKAGAQVAIEGKRVVREYTGRDGQPKVSTEIHSPTLTLEKAPKERVEGVAVEMKGAVVYDPELKASSGNKYYTMVTVQPENGTDKVRAVFFGDEAKDVARSVKKGMTIGLEGNLVEKEYTNREGVQTKGLEVQRASWTMEKATEKSVKQPPAKQAARGRQNEQGLG
jgi:single-stranded DNA-binding protein